MRLIKVVQVAVVSMMIVVGCGKTTEVVRGVSERIPDDYQASTRTGRVLIIGRRVYRLVQERRALELSEAETERIDLVSIVDDLETIRREVGISEPAGIKAGLEDIQARLVEMIVSPEEALGVQE